MLHTQPLPTIPDLVALAAQAPHTFPVLLQSSGTTGIDLLLALPREPRLYFEGDGAQFVSDLACLPLTPVPHSESLPFLGGWFVYLGYELLHTFEPSVGTPLPDPFPLAALVRHPAAIVVDRDRQTATLVAETTTELAELTAALVATAGWQAQPLTLQHIEEDDPARFTEAIARIHDYIRDGDVFQVNLSRQWQATLNPDVSPADVFAALRQANPAPFSALVQFGAAGSIVSSSPERLVRVTPEGVADTRPIAGTHPRAADPVEDASLKARLIGDLKERAEHVMLIDLERNDLGRICRPGSVEVNELMTVASYATVHHIESNVRGRLRDGLTPADVFRALFPGGTITGCPKVRCMQIIRELESSPRRAYTGSLGYINRDGSMDTNILIRTFMQEGNRLRFRAGAGIVIDSQPERELQETRHKARGLLRALGLE
ncbi:aminodeoxychorismate synthase component I [Laribacter hongkongensis]|uniref:aminodeoxychorismate synthase component I n=1 Tax=Laribacter hongkongensis TaxID=168471 RepID=UPI001EFC59B4|nr:aminodeoxychorismate synthase component I [Laribacter hongkongensis]MCG9058329.1 aminodeoxychorismate synthase component I [Laribacter hongkongensis]MCG9085230.1 aminodeoxychorismate synthase component I [Laribacter hongkongensis]